MMCMVSNVTDYMRNTWPEPVTLSGAWITQEQWEEYMRLKRAAERFDTVTKQSDCVKPEVAEWEKKMEDFLRKDS